MEKDAFVSRGLTELEEFVAKFIRLATRELGAFNGLTKLKILILRYKEIREIIPGIFENVRSLEYLDLDPNIIQHLQVDVFSGLT